MICMFLVLSNCGPRLYICSRKLGIVLLFWINRRHAVYVQGKLLIQLHAYLKGLSTEAYMVKGWMNNWMYIYIYMERDMDGENDKILSMFLLYCVNITMGKIYLVCEGRPLYTKVHDKMGRRMEILIDEEKGRGNERTRMISICVYNYIQIRLCCLVRIKLWKYYVEQQWIISRWQYMN